MYFNPYHSSFESHWIKIPLNSNLHFVLFPNVGIFPEMMRWIIRSDAFLLSSGSKFVCLTQYTRFGKSLLILKRSPHSMQFANFTGSFVFFNFSETFALISFLFARVLNFRLHVWEQNLPDPYSPLCSFLQVSQIFNCSNEFYVSIRTIECEW